MRIAIAGAGSVGRSIAGELVENGHQVMLIDRDPEAIKPGRIEAAEWVLADACEVALLEDATGARVAYLMRFGMGTLGTPSTVIQDGDQIFMLVTDDTVGDVLDIASGSQTEGH